MCAYKDAADYNYQPCIIPKDKDGFVVTFSIDEEKEYLEFFDKYGIVVIRNIISDEECDKSEKEVWKYLEEKNGAKKDDPATWKGGHLGILGNDVTMSEQAIKNRQHPNIYRFFCTLFGTSQLYCSVDRYGMMRPTKNIKFPGEKDGVDMKQWKSLENWLHLDMNPWTGRTSTYGFQGNYSHFSYNPTRDDQVDIINEHFNAYKILKVQGILGLYDNSEKEGGLHGVPGFHHHCKAWAKANEHLASKLTYPNVPDETTVQIPKDDPIRNDIQKLPIRKGSLLVWNSMIPHGTFPNDSNKFRLIQYIKMAPVKDESIIPTIPSYLFGMDPYISGSLLDNYSHFTPLGRKLMGIDAWPDGPDYHKKLIQKSNECRKEREKKGQI